MNPDLIVQLLKVITAAQVTLREKWLELSNLNQIHVKGKSGDPSQISLDLWSSARMWTRGANRRESRSALVRETWTLGLQPAHQGSHRSALQRAVHAH